MRIQERMSVRVLQVYARKGDRNPEKFKFLIDVFHGSEEKAVTFMDYLVQHGLLNYIHTPPKTTADFVISSKGEEIVKALKFLDKTDKDLSLVIEKSKRIAKTLAKLSKTDKDFERIS